MNVLQNVKEQDHPEQILDKFYFFYDSHQFSICILQEQLALSPYGIFASNNRTSCQHPVSLY